MSAGRSLESYIGQLFAKQPILSEHSILEQTAGFSKEEIKSCLSNLVESAVLYQAEYQNGDTIYWTWQADQNHSKFLLKLKTLFSANHEVEDPIIRRKSQKLAIELQNSIKDLQSKIQNHEISATQNFDDSAIEKPTLDQARAIKNYENDIQAIERDISQYQSIIRPILSELATAYKIDQSLILSKLQISRTCQSLILGHP